MDDLTRIIIEAVSAIACVVLVRFMIKPYQLTRERRYLGFPLGFGILGLSYFLTVLLATPLFSSNATLSWLGHLTRTFAFLFLAVTYFFSKKPSKNSRLLWDLALSLLIIGLITVFLVIVFAPREILSDYLGAVLFVRIFGIVCLSYIIIHTLRSYIAKENQASLWIPLGFIFLAISQGLLLSVSFWSS
jgi:hypothetical protein